MYLKTSKMRYNSNIEDVECSEERNLSKQMPSEHHTATLYGGKICLLQAYRLRQIISSMCPWPTGMLPWLKNEYINMNKFIERIVLKDGWYVLESHIPSGKERPDNN